MTPPDQLHHPRTFVRPRCALMPVAGYPFSVLPKWPGCPARILCSPALGAGFTEYLLDLPAGGDFSHAADGRVETFYYVLSGRIDLDGNDLPAGGFALMPHDDAHHIKVTEPARLLMLKKLYEPAAGVKDDYLIVGHEKDVPADPYLGDAGVRLQVLLPDKLPFDLAMNIFTFDPGTRLPVVETHVMEHGLLFLQGRGVYYLDDCWMEAGEGDFIWMGPYVPQSFYAAGPGSAKYLYYKNVNRDVSL